MTGYDDMPTAADDVLEQVHSARAEIEAIIDELSHEQMTRATDDGGWTIKDHLAHITEWQRRGLRILEGRPAWEALGIDEEKFRTLDTDGINEILHERNREKSLPQVLTDFRKTQERVIHTIEQMNEDDLERAIPEERHAHERRIIDLIQSNFSGHDSEHVEDIRQLANQPVD